MRDQRALEVTGVVVVLAALAIFLVTSYSLIPFSDPMKWFAFGRDFVASFATVKLAYGFPLYLSGAIAVVGPFYGFLANIPLLVALAALVYGFARYHGSTRTLVSPSIAAAAALLFWISANPEMLLHLANPYRDVLSHVFVLLAGSLLIGFRRDPRHPLRLIAASGACLALACSARETAVLMGIPFALYAIASRREERGLPFARPALVFAVGFAVAILPLLVQNHLVSGSSFLPGQAAAGLERTGKPIPGMSFDHFRTTFPATLQFLGSHYGVVGVVLLLAGLAASFRLRITVALWLSLPALLTYAVFYGFYNRVVERYLFVLDLFAAPLAGVGAAAALSLAFRVLRGTELQHRAVGATLGLIFLLAAVAPFRAPAHASPRFRLSDARSVRKDMISFVPDGAEIAGERPLAEIANCFAGDRLDVHPMVLKISEVSELLDGRDPVFFLSRSQQMRQLLQRDFELEPIVSFGERHYGLPVGVERFWIDRLRLLGDGHS